MPPLYFLNSWSRNSKSSLYAMSCILLALTHGEPSVSPASWNAAGNRTLQTRLLLGRKQLGLPLALWQVYTVDEGTHEGPPGSSQGNLRRGTGTLMHSFMIFINFSEIYKVYFQNERSSMQHFEVRRKKLDS